MKTKIFIKCLEDQLGYITHKYKNRIAITDKFDNPLADVHLGEAFNIDTDYRSFRYLDENERKLLFDLMYEYTRTRTPIKEREEEKKYYVELKNDVLAYNMHGRFLNLSESDERYLFSNQESTRYYTSQFTQKQLDKMPDEVKEVLPLCKQIEVTS